MITVFKAKNNKLNTRTKLSVFDTSAIYWGNMLECINCNDTWNNHAPSPFGKVPAGMCLTDDNLKQTSTFIME